MRRILFVGAGPFTLGAIDRAQRRGFEVITTDNVPANPGHQVAGRAFDVDAVDIDGVAALARDESVAAVIGYASEVCSLTAAAVSERLHLPGPGYEAALRLSLKDRFRAWTAEAGIQTVAHAVFPAGACPEASRWAERLGRPVAIKPVDNSGSRGVTVAPRPDGFASAFGLAAAASRCGRVLVEERIGRRGAQLCGDGFVEDGELVFAAFGENRALPSGGGAAIFLEQYPPSHSPDDLDKVRSRLAEIIAASGFRRGPINFDAIIQSDGEPHVFEVGIRNGGNLIPQALGLMHGVDLAGVAVDCATDEAFRFPDLPADLPPRFLITYVAHSRVPGTFKRLVLSDAIRDAVEETLMFRQRGDAVNAFRSASDTVAVLLLSFATREQMLAAAGRMGEHCVVELGRV